MSRWNWVVIFALLALLFGVVVWSDKGSYLNAVATGACRACPAPPVCNPQSFGRLGRVGRAPPAIDGCDPPWWRRHALRDTA